jgi:hypothetical protein
VENQLYIRMRGRILGPYDQEKLQSLARRGQLSRMHELSADATNWVRASTYPELFVSEDAPTAAAPPETPGTGKVHEPPGRPAGPRWWYGKNGTESGPVDQTTLQQLLASGNISLDDLVWSEGMTQWLPARHAPGLLPSPPGFSAPRGGVGAAATPAGAKEELSSSLCKAASKSWAWVIFIAIVGFISAGLQCVVGILELIHGGKDHLTAVVAAGLFSLIFGADVAAGGFLLSAYARRVASLRYSNHPVVLEKALDTLQTFWVYVSINLIVLLAFFVFLLVWMIAVGGTIPWL